MKKKFLYTLLIIIAVFITYVAYVINNPTSPLETVNLNEDNSDVSITYSRPYKNERLIFGDSEEALVPFNKYWRTGANRHTYLENIKELTFNEQILPAGKYSIYTIPGENEWDVYFNSNVNYLGISKPNESDDVLSLKVPVVKLLNEIEQFTIEFEKDSQCLRINLLYNSIQFFLTY